MVSDSWAVDGALEAQEYPEEATATPQIAAKLYWFPLSHPSWAVRKMLELKGIDFETVPVLPGMQRIHLRLARFRGGTVPALTLNGRRVQGSRRISRALEELAPEPPLFPSEPVQRMAVEEAEQWGEQELQPVPRVALRWGLVQNSALRRWLAGASGMPMPAVAARFSVPMARYYAHVIGANEAAARGAVRDLPLMLDRTDALLAEGLLTRESPNAATLQILSSVRALEAFLDFQGMVAARPSAVAARELFPHFPGSVPRFIPRAWLPPSPGQG